MTKALDLFYNRRARLGRNESVLGSDRVSAHDRRRNHHNHGHGSSTDRRVDRNDLNGCDYQRRNRSSVNRSSALEHESPWASYSGNVNNIESEFNIEDRMVIARDERLPSAVLLARERLLHRLRGVSLSGNRRSNRVPANIRRTELQIADNFYLADAIDWETEISREQQAGAGMSFYSPRMEKVTRPPGLTKEALESLHVLIFPTLDHNKNETSPSMIRDCSICLETFLEGDKLMCLPCGHMFHNGCLVPWVQTCGDCPYCRAGI